MKSTTILKIRSENAPEKERKQEIIEGLIKFIQKNYYS